MTNLITAATISNKIHTMRGFAVMLDRELAELLNPTVQKNLTVQNQGN